MKDPSQHELELVKNRHAWERKPLLRRLYADFYRGIVSVVDATLPGQIVEIGSGMGNLKQHLPSALATDLVAHAWLDLVCDGYEMPFRNATLSHLILFDVFHHLQAPRAFLCEARRVLRPDGRLILFEPYISLASFPVYGLLHHEPVNWRLPIDPSQRAPHLRPRSYYAAKGNATRLFFHQSNPEFLDGWRLFHAQAFSAFSYLLSGGYSKPALLPDRWLPVFQRIDVCLTRWPRLFGARCLVGLSPA